MQVRASALLRAGSECKRIGPGYIGRWQMLTIHMGTTAGPVAVSEHAGGWRVHQPIRDTFAATLQSAPCMAVDPVVPTRLYLGMAHLGLWHSDDAGETWRRTLHPARTIW